MEVPAGLTNLGNTCYMNAVVQCLKVVPELREALKRYKEEFSVTSLASAQSITAAMRSVFDQMAGSNTVTPILLLQTLHMTFPQFAQTGENGGYRQQVCIIKLILKNWHSSNCVIEFICLAYTLQILGIHG